MTTYPAEGRMLDRTASGSPELSFKVNSPQKIHDDWRNTDRIMRYYGTCRTCGIRTYGFDDGENDPRGPLGDHAADPLVLADHLSTPEAAEVNRVGGVTLPACFTCTNDYDAYHALINKATRIARHKGADI